MELPVLYYPFPSAINQHYKALSLHTYEWVRSFNLLDELGCQKIFAINFEVLIARAYPNISLEGLEVITDFMYWGTILDDGFEKAGKNKQLKMLELEQTRLLDIMKGAELTEFDTPIAFAWRDILQRMQQFSYATSEWWLYYIKSVESFFQGVHWEALNHSHGITPDLASFMKMRHLLFGAYAFLDTILITDGIALPPEVIECPVVKQLVLSASNAMAWANDIFSVKRELKEGMVHNLVLVLQHEYQIPFEKAFKHAVELHDEQVRNFIELSVQLPSFGAEIDVNLQRYISGLRFWMKGHLDWMIESPRYGKYSED